MSASLLVGRMRFSGSVRAGTTASSTKVASETKIPVTRSRGWWRKEGVPGARVRLHGTPYAAVADEAGFFTFDGLPEGRYILVAVGEGLGRRVIERVEVVKGDTVSVILP